MPAKDIYHDVVKRALVKDGWVITHDPLRLRWGARDLYVDLGAEQLLAAEQEGKKIAIEIKSFVGPSSVADLEQALGQYVLYYTLLHRIEPQRVLYVAIRESIFNSLFEEPIGEVLLEDKRVQLLVFDPKEEIIIKWVT